MRSMHPDVISARERLNRTLEVPSDTQKINEARSSLSSVYDRLLADDIEEKVQLVERAHQSSQYGEAWRIVNQISGCKKSAIGRINGTCPKERIDKWYNHFKSLLGNPPVSVDVDQDPDIPEVLSDLSIEDGPFSEEEYTRVKNASSLERVPVPTTSLRRFSSAAI